MGARAGQDWHGSQGRREVAEHLRERFSTQQWQDEHQSLMINQVVVFEADQGEVKRPRIEEEFDKVPGIRESFGFIASGTAGSLSGTTGI